MFLIKQQISPHHHRDNWMTGQKNDVIVVEMVIMVLKLVR